MENSTILNDTNFSNETVLPIADALDYAEIILLTTLVLVGGPMNIISFVQTLGLCSTISCSSFIKRETDSCQNKKSCRNKKSASAPKKRSPASARSMLLKLHLTAANLIIILFYGLSQICWLSTYAWRGGDFMCRLIKFFDTFCFYATSNIVVLIAIERVMVAAFIDQPRSVAKYKESLKYTVWVPWILAIVCSLPQLFIWRVFSPYADDEWTQCITVWMVWRVRADPVSDEFSLIIFQERLYSGIHLTLVFWCPALIVLTSYAIILIRFHQHIRKSTREARRTQWAVNAAQFRKRAATFHRAASTAATPPPSTMSGYALERESSCSSAIDNSIVVHQNHKQHLQLHTDDQQPRSAAFMMEVPIVVNSSRILIFQPTFTNVAVQTLTRVKRRTVRTTAWILFAYIACWTPYNALELSRYLDVTIDNRYLELLSNLIVLNAVVNPLIYKM